MSRFLRKDLGGLCAYTPGEQPRDFNGVIKLNTNENPFDPPASVIKAGEVAAARARLYPDPTLFRLKTAMAEYLGAGIEQVTLTNGSDEGLAFIMAAFCEKQIVTLNITYSFYKNLAGLYRVAVKEVPLNADMTVNVEALKKTKGVLFLANPNAPTGIALSLNDIESLLGANPNRLVVVDEAYIAFGGASAVPLIAKHQNLIVSGTFSKSFSLAGGRIGYLVSNADIIKDLEAVRCSFNPYNVSLPAQTMAEAALKSPEFKDYTATVIKNRTALTRALRGIGFHVLDSAANFVLASPPDGDGAKCYQSLKAQNILVRYFSSAGLERFVRITVGTEAQIERLLDALKAIYKTGETI